MKFLVGVYVVLAATTSIQAQGVLRSYDPVNEFSGFAEYSNDSSHILIGEAFNRKLVAVGVSYSRRLRGNRFVTWRWQADMRPFVDLRNPQVTHDETITYISGATPIPGLPPGNTQQVHLASGECSSGSSTGYLYSNNSFPGSAPIGTYSFNNSCRHPWAYGGAVSPIGQTFNLLPERRLQPFLAANGGFVIFDTVIPYGNATQFNFTFEVGAGLKYYLKPNRAISVDYRYHHISNSSLGNDNPGVDNGVLKVAYLFGH